MRAISVFLTLTVLCIAGIMTGCSDSSNLVPNKAEITVDATSGYWLEGVDGVLTRNFVIHIKNVSTVKAENVNVKLYEILPNGLEAKVVYNGVEKSTGLIYVEGIWPATKPGIQYVPSRTTITVDEITVPIGDNIISPSGHNIAEILPGQTVDVEIIYQMRTE